MHFNVGNRESAIGNEPEPQSLAIVKRETVRQLADETKYSFARGNLKLETLKSSEDCQMLLSFEYKELKTEN